MVGIIKFEVTSTLTKFPILPFKQLEKQQKLNELTVVATLKLHQVQHVANGGLHHDLSPTLVFASGGVVRLQHRIKELEHEKLSQKKQMRLV